MLRFLMLLFGVLLLWSAPAPASAVEGVSVSRHERDVLQAQKRLIKHRKAKAKAFVKRQRAKAKRLIKQQRST